MDLLKNVKAIRSEVYFDENKISIESLMKRVPGEGENSRLLANKYKEIFNNNKYGFLINDCFFDSPPGKDKYSFVIDVYFGPDQIGEYLKFEKELLDGGYDVRFCRRGDPIFKEN